MPDGRGWTDHALHVDRHAPTGAKHDVFNRQLPIRTFLM